VCDTSILGGQRDSKQHKATKQYTCTRTCCVIPLDDNGTFPCVFLPSPNILVTSLLSLHNTRHKKQRSSLGVCRNALLRVVSCLLGWVLFRKIRDSNSFAIICLPTENGPLTHQHPHFLQYMKGKPFHLLIRIIVTFSSSFHRHLCLLEIPHQAQKQRVSSSTLLFSLISRFTLVSLSRRILAHGICFAQYNIPGCPLTRDLQLIHCNRNHI
jgi:hypothetical protein